MAELLAPAGSLESLCGAVNAGADAVYIGGSRFGARAYADNPETEELLRGLDYCHVHGRKLYLTVNTLLKEQELENSLYDFLLPYYLEGLDGVIVQDVGVVRFIQCHFPGLPVHGSTQMTVTGPDGARLLKESGVTRIVPARELSLEEIKTIIRETGLEVETFIHGAMCYSYSGQCLLSSMIGGRSGNRGRCAQPCRLPYELLDSQGKRMGEQKHLLSMKDMCTLSILPELLDAGIASLKIEGRMKRPEYTAGVVRVYRKYMDLWQEGGAERFKLKEENLHRTELEEADLRELMDLYNRGGFASGYYHCRNGKEMMSMDRPNHHGTRALQIKKSRKQAVTGVALESLYRGDVLELVEVQAGTRGPGSEASSAENGKQGRRGFSPEFTMREDALPGQTVELPPSFAFLREGSVLSRTKCEQLLGLLREQYVEKKCKEKIKGDLRILKGSPAILELSFGKHSVQVRSEGEVLPARSRPLREDEVRKQMNRTGDTPFEFCDLSIRLDPEVFLPVKEQNELRRRGMNELEKQILDPYRRREHLVDHSGESPADFEKNTVNCQKAANFDPDGVNIRNAASFRVLVTNCDQLEAALSYGRSHPGIDSVYLDLLTAAGQTNSGLDYHRLEEHISAVHNAGCRCFLSFPPVFRQKDRVLFETPEMERCLLLADGYLLHTLDELAYIRDRLQTLEKRADIRTDLTWTEPFSDRQEEGRNSNRKEGFLGKELVGDTSLYAWNRSASGFYREWGVNCLTFPEELNCRELKPLFTGMWELVVYGRQALMHSAQCLLKNTEGCKGSPGVWFLRDRKRAVFPVINRCMGCCNTIYNSVPLQLLDCQTEIGALSPDFLRLSFTIENRQETQQILEMYSAGFALKNLPAKNLSDGTRGHFRRGVE